MTETTSGGLSAAERAAVKARAAELRAQEKARDKRASGERDVRAKIAELDGSDRRIAERFYAIVIETAPQLVPKTYYGMPGFAGDDGKMVVFFQPASKFAVRYATIGFDQAATLDDGTMWPVAWAVTELGDAEADFLADRLTAAIR